MSGFSGPKFFEKRTSRNPGKMRRFPLLAWIYFPPKQPVTLDRRRQRANFSSSCLDSSEPKILLDCGPDTRSKNLFILSGSANPKFCEKRSRQSIRRSGGFLSCLASQLISLSPCLDSSEPKILGKRVQSRREDLSGSIHKEHKPLHLVLVHGSKFCERSSRIQTR